MVDVDVEGTRGSARQLVLVAGAAGDIGKAAVASFAARSFAIVALDRAPLDDPPADVAVTHTVDLLDDGALAAVAAAVPEVGNLRHVAVIAGGGDPEELSQDDPATEELSIFRSVLETNLVSAFATIRHSLPVLRAAAGDRSITLVSSINAFGGYGAPAYSAAKAGMIGLVNSLAGPLGADGIRINCLALGTTNTGNLHHLARITGKVLDLDAVARKAPLRRVLTPAEVGEALAVMATNMPGLTGSTVVLDNGQTLVR